MITVGHYEVSIEESRKRGRLREDVEFLIKVFFFVRIMIQFAFYSCLEISFKVLNLPYRIDPLMREKQEGHYRTLTKRI